ncbi:hypothetical protein FACS189427_13850 [Planctomycetales bacterium]|nr:hypothetical protein FACS189427_13850 [Planctomycetales bacterium]
MAVAGNAQEESNSPNEKLSFASIGIGGKGGSDSDNAAKFGNAVAICDVDKQRLEIKGKGEAFQKAKHGDKRRTEISGEELEAVDYEGLMEEETMVVSITQSGYIKRTPVAVYQAQKRGGKGRIGAKTTDEDDEIQHLFVTTTHNYLMFFTNKGKCYWQKVYELPEAAAASRGRSIANVLQLAEGEKVSECLAVKDFLQDEHYLVFATKKGIIKKTEPLR